MISVWFTEEYAVKLIGLPSGGAAIVEVIVFATFSLINSTTRNSCNMKFVISVNFTIFPFCVLWLEASIIHYTGEMTIWLIFDFFIIYGEHPSFYSFHLSLLEVIPVCYVLYSKNHYLKHPIQRKNWQN